jgi:hypothetical protein
MKRSFPRSAWECLYGRSAFGTWDAERPGLHSIKPSTPETIVMSELTFKHKQAHYEKVCRSNYLASLHFAGFDTSPANLDKPLPKREEALAKYQQDKPSQPAPALPHKPADQ